MRWEKKRRNETRIPSIDFNTFSSSRCILLFVDIAIVCLLYFRNRRCSLRLNHRHWCWTRDDDGDDDDDGVVPVRFPFIRKRSSSSWWFIYLYLLLCSYYNNSHSRTQFYTREICVEKTKARVYALFVIFTTRWHAVDIASCAYTYYMNKIQIMLQQTWVDTVVKGNEHDSFETQLRSASGRLDGATEHTERQMPNAQNILIWNFHGTRAVLIFRRRRLCRQHRCAQAHIDHWATLSRTAIHYSVDFRQRQFGRVSANTYFDIAFELSLRGIRDVAAAGANE